MGSSKPFYSSLRIGLAALLLCCTRLMTSAYGQENALPPVPELLLQLEASDKFERRDAAMYLAAHGPAAAEAVPALIEALDDRETQVWFHAVTALSRIGPAAQTAIPRLMRDLERFSDRGSNPKWYRSVHALGMIGSPALAPLGEALDHRDEDVRAGAAAALGWMGKEAQETTPLLVGRLGDSDAFVREKAAESLALIGPTVLPALDNPLGSDSEHERLGVARVAYHMGRDAISLGPKLQTLAQSDESARVQAVAIEALSRIGASHDEHAAVLFSRFSQDSDEVRQAVKNGLLSLPPQYTVHRLIHILEGEEDEQSMQAADLLGRIGPDAEDAVIPLINAVAGDRSQEVQEVYRQALVDIGPVAAPFMLRLLETTPAERITERHWVVMCLREMGLPALACLNEHVSHEHPNARLCAILALQGMGREASDSEPLLREHFDDPVTPVRAAAIPAAVAVSKQPAQLLDRIAPLLEDDNPKVRLAATTAITTIGASAVSLVPELTAMLADPEIQVRWGAVQALGGIGPRAESACDAIAGLLVSTDNALKLESVRALGDIGVLSETALGQLTALAGNAQGRLKEAALVSLGQIGRDAIEAIPVVMQALSDPNDSIRAAAVVGFGRIETSPERLMPVMDEALEDPSREIRHAAAQRVAQLRDKATSATPKLIEMLADNEDQSVALKALGSIPPAVEYLSLYIESISHGDYIVRGYSCEAIGRLREKAKEALPALRKARQDRSRFVRQRASRAIDRVEGRS